MTDNLKQKADAILSGAVAAGAVAGVSATVLNKDKVVYEGSAGARALGGDAPMDVDSVCWIASMTKPLASLAAVQLVERGALSMDAPLGGLAPELSAIQVLDGFTADGAPHLRPPKRAITLRDLLTHTSGLGYELFSQDVLKMQAALGIPGLAEGKLTTLNVPLLFDPGERWEYGVSTDWVGRVAEAASGQSLGDYLAANVFAPLGMESTAFGPTTEMRTRLASMHMRTPDGGLAPFPFETLPVEYQSGGGGLYSTTRDYGRFVRAMLGDGAPLVGPVGMALLSENQMGALRVTEIKTATPFSLDAEIFPGVPKGWTAAFQINLEPAPTGRSAGGLMWAGLANSYFWIDRTAGVGGVTMMQLAPFADARAVQVWHDFETAAYAACR
ncbi:MAG: serine hydrolase domain-containing protein [Terricaulis sp.]